MGDASEPWNPNRMKEHPVLNLSANSLFFTYLVIVVALCPLCARVANHFSK